VVIVHDLLAVSEHHIPVDPGQPGLQKVHAMELDEAGDDVLLAPDGLDVGTDLVHHRVLAEGGYVAHYRGFGFEFGWAVGVTLFEGVILFQ
jgi:hypothetical protein